MQTALSATKLVEKANEEETNNSIIPDWVVRVGGAALVLGGLGYLWYRNSSLRAYHQLKREDFFRLQFKMENKVFIKSYIISRIVYNQSLMDFKLRNPTLVFDLRHPDLGKKFVSEVNKPLEQQVTPIILEELKKSDYPKISFKLFMKKNNTIMKEISLKRRQGGALTELEKKSFNIFCVSTLLNMGLVVEAFMGLDLGEVAERLDHKECLQRLLDYEAETIQACIELYKKIVIVGGMSDLQKRGEELKKLLEMRFRMDSLERYTLEKLGPAYAEIQEEQRYHPLVLFLSKALTPPQVVGYRADDVDRFFNHVVFLKQGYLSIVMSRNPGSRPLEQILPALKDLMSVPNCQTFLESSGLKFDPYKNLV